MDLDAEAYDQHARRHQGKLKENLKEVEMSGKNMVQKNGIGKFTEKLKQVKVSDKEKLTDKLKIVQVKGNEKFTEKLKNVEMSGKVPLQKMITPLSKACKNLRFYARMMTSENPIMIPMDETLLGTKYTLFVSKEDIMQFLDMQSLNTSCIEFYIRFLHDLCCKMNIAHACGFLHPSLIANGNSVSDRADYMGRHMKEIDKSWYLVPYIDPSPNVLHLMLCVINPRENQVYWLDPLGKKVRSDIRVTIDSGLLTYGAVVVQGTEAAHSYAQWITDSKMS